MLYKLLRLGKFCFIALRRQVKFGIPNHAPIAIIDAAGQQFLLGLFAEYRYVVIGNPIDIFYVNPRVLWAFIRCFAHVRRPEVAYAAALLRFVQPKIAVTLIDNADFFYEVSSLCQDIRFLAIQNANRIDVLFLPIEVSRQIHIPEFACFGDYERDLYAQCGAKVGRFYPIGSLKDAQYRETVPSVERAQEYDLCVVSEGAAGTDKEWFPGMEWAIVLILQHAMRFCEKHRRRLCVAGKRPDLKYFELEKSMYTKYLGPDIPIVMPTRYAHSTARLIDGSAVSLAICSTALKEGLGRGNKVLFCNFTSEPRLDFPVDGIWLLTDSSFEEFEKRMLLLLEMDNAEFNKLAKYATHYVMSYDPQKPTTAFLRELIDDAVSK